MLDINIRKATKSDIDLLIKLRLDFLSDNKRDNLTPDEEKAITKQLNEYFQKYIDTDDFIAVLAEADGIIAATAFLVIIEKPVNLRSFPTGKTALILNVLTYPEYRYHGIATKLLGILIDAAKKANASFIELTATPMGKSVYEKLGFTEHSNGNYTEMKLNLL
jgi:GNAT superfamily N-acetyltransferase